MVAATAGLTGVVFSVLLVLLGHLDPSTQRVLPEARTLLDAARALLLDMCAGLDRFIDKRTQHGLTMLQKRYAVLSSRGHTASLYLFEYAHDESRGRGQAMVDLLNIYEKQGLHLQPGELPDYLPVFLGYLSRLPKKEARSLLAETDEISQAITMRLTERANRHRSAVGTLLLLAGIRHSASSDGEGANDDIDAPPSAVNYRAFNAAYADRPIRFVDAGTPVTKPLHFYDKRPGRPRDPREPC